MNGNTLPAGKTLEPGLYLIATPIGAARDITLRALDILATAQVIAAEDTRSLRHLMEIHGIPLGDRPLISYHDHNADSARPRLMAALAAGKSVVYASEAGTPLVADPGYQLARAAVAEGYRLISAPGPSAVLAALTMSGLPSDRFLFAGFPPNAKGARATFLRELAPIPATLILYESPKRLGALLAEAAAQLGETRQAAICRELTKRFEEVRRGTLGELAQAFAGAPPKGEIVVLVDRARSRAATQEDVDAALADALSRLSVKDAAAEIAAALGLPKREVYQRALDLGRKARE